MDRKVSKKKYITAFILTLFIFAGGIFIGILFENVRLNHSEQSILKEKVSLRSLQLQQKYIDAGLADCNTLNEILETNINELIRKMAEVTSYERNAILNQAEFELQLQDYFLTEIQYLLLAQDIDKTCSKDGIKIIYFYDESAFDTQGDILDYLKKLFGGRVLVFSLNSEFKEKEPMINILLTSYNISQFPSVVVNDKVFHGHTDVEILLGEVCDGFKEMNKDVPQECTEFKGTKNKIKSPILS